MYAKFDIPASTSRCPHRYRRLAATVLGTVASLAVIAVATSPDASAAPTDFTCEESTTAQLVTGAGPGDTSSGPGSILAFNHAFYVERSPDRALAYILPGHVTTRDWLLTGIEFVPTDTHHCVRIRPLIGAGERWAVTVTEYQPSAEPAQRTFSQTVITRTADEMSLISDIAPA